MVRRIPIQAYVAVVASGMIFLLIFMGAWVVSADEEGTAWDVAFGGYSAQSQLGDGPGDLPATHRDNFPTAEGGEVMADSWWGKSLLTACPFH